MAMLKNCDTCRANNSVEFRQSIACGFELPVENASAWQHRSGKTNADTCAGYLTNLPEVIEAARARLHWKHGGLRDFCHGQPHDNIMTAIEIIDGAAGEVESFVMKEKP